ncbi:MAG TPA: TasA family protein [Microthrixaceae bacterium]|nr:TasA family protein [Microthrixaceae bacterium]
MDEHSDPIEVVRRPRSGATRRRGRRVRAVLALGSVVGLGVVATSAAFSDRATVTAQLTAGTLDITVDGAQGNPVPYPLTFPGAEAIAPGQTVYAPLEVANVGTVDADLSMSTTVTPDGTPQNATDDLEMTVVHTAGSSCDAAVVAADPAPYVAPGPVADATFEDVPLAGGGALDLCFAVTLPASVTGTGGGGAEVVLELLAEQAGA